MKTSAVLASMLFGSLAVAAPVDRRALVYTTEILTETVVVYTTVYDDDFVSEATTTPAGYFYEQPQPSSAAAQSTPAPQAPSPSPAPEQKPSSQAPAPAPVNTPTPSPSPAPAPVEQPKPVEQPQPSSAAYVAAAPAPTSTAAAPAPAATSAAPAASYPSTGSGASGQSFSNVDITIYDNPNNGYGACGTVIHESDMTVALAQGLWGQSTYDVMTGAATNKWCGQKIQITYQGNSIEATIMDLCPGCLGPDDIDLTPAAWKQLTGSDEKTRYKASWTTI